MEDGGLAGFDFVYHVLSKVGGCFVVGNWGVGEWEWEVLGFVVF